MAFILAELLACSDKKAGITSLPLHHYNGKRDKVTATGYTAIVGVPTSLEGLHAKYHALMSPC